MKHHAQDLSKVRLKSYQSRIKVGKYRIVLSIAILSTSAEVINAAKEVLPHEIPLRSA